MTDSRRRCATGWTHRPCRDPRAMYSRSGLLPVKLAKQHHPAAAQLHELLDPTVPLRFMKYVDKEVRRAPSANVPNVKPRAPHDSRCSRAGCPPYCTMQRPLRANGLYYVTRILRARCATAA